MNADKLVQTATDMAKQGKMREAMELFNQAIEQDPRNVTAYVNRGSTYGRTGNFQLALEDFVLASQLEPSNGKIHFLVGSAYRDLNRKDEACQAFLLARENGWAINPEIVRYCQS